MMKKTKKGLGHVLLEAFISLISTGIGKTKR